MDVPRISPIGELEHDAEILAHERSSGAPWCRVVCRCGYRSPLVSIVDADRMRAAHLNTVVTSEHVARRGICQECGEPMQLDGALVPAHDIGTRACPGGGQTPWRVTL